MYLLESMLTRLGTPLLLLLEYSRVRMSIYSNLHYTLLDTLVYQSIVRLYIYSWVHPIEILVLLVDRIIPSYKSTDFAPSPPA